MYILMWMLFVWALSFIGCDCSVLDKNFSRTDPSEETTSSRPNNKFSNIPYIYPRSENILSEEVPQRTPPEGRACGRRLETALDKIRRRQLLKQKTLDLQGYSLHQPLRNAPFDMYVTRMRVRVPTSHPWVAVDRCRFDPNNASLETRLLFNDLTISGRVSLLGEGEVRTELQDETCNMLLRLRKAGIGFHTEPIRLERGQFNVRTDSHFLEPGFISVYAYGCDKRFKKHRRTFSEENDEEEDEDDDEDLSREMEDVFLKGIRTLLTTYMQKELQPAIKETLMTNLGYTVSYG